MIDDKVTEYKGQANAVLFHDGGHTQYICSAWREQIAQVFYEYLYYPFELQAVAPDIMNIYTTTLER